MPKSGAGFVYEIAVLINKQLSLCCYKIPANFGFPGLADISSHLPISGTPNHSHPDNISNPTANYSVLPTSRPQVVTAMRALTDGFFLPDLAQQSVPCFVGALFRISRG